MGVRQLHTINAVRQSGFQKNGGMMVSERRSVLNVKMVLDTAGFVVEYMDVLHFHGNGADPTHPTTKSETAIEQEECGP